MTGTITTATEAPDDKEEKYSSIIIIFPYFLVDRAQIIVKFATKPYNTKAVSTTEANFSCWK